MFAAGSLLPFLPSNPAFPAFVSFLPVVFFMVAQWQRRSEKTVAELQKRIESLEAIVTARKAGAV
jgi:hypothetical protein